MGVGAPRRLTTAKTLDGIERWALNKLPGRVIRFMLDHGLDSFTQVTYWRDLGYLTPSGGITNPGKGGHFDWEAALDQILWLAAIDATAGRVDFFDGRGGFALRAAGAAYGIRVGLAPWKPFTPGDPLPDEPYMLAPVR